MTQYSTRIHAPAADAPSVTELVAVCDVCAFSWPILSETLADAKGCSFCGAPEEAISVVSERADYEATILDGRGVW